MLLEDSFAFEAPDDSRIAGSRVGLEHVLFYYTFHVGTAEEIVARYPTLTLDQVYATILYYLRNREQVDADLADWLAWSRAERERQAADPAWQGIEQRLREAQGRHVQESVAAGQASG
jgi:uncharacterized protein (DUF433 family)